MMAVLLWVSLQSNAQVNLDSIWNVWDDSSIVDSTRIDALLELSHQYLHINPDSSLLLAKQAFKMASTRSLENRMAKGLLLQGYYHYLRAEFNEAMEFANSSLEICLKNKKRYKIEIRYNLIANIYSGLGFYNKAIEYQLKSLKFSKEHFE